MVNEILIGPLNGYLSVVAAQLGEHPLDHAFYSSIYSLNRQDILNDIKKYLFNPEKLDRYGSEGDCTFSEIQMENNWVYWLENFFNTLLNEKIKQGRYITGHLMDFVSFIIEADSSLKCLYHLEFKNKESKGTIILIPCESASDFLLLIFEESIEKHKIISPEEYHEHIKRVCLRESEISRVDCKD